MAAEAPREQEQSIKERKKEIFEEEQHDGTAIKKFPAYLKETPPAPLSKAQKYALGGAFGFVVLLLLLALLTRPAPRRHVRTPAAPATAPAHAAGH